MMVLAVLAVVGWLLRMKVEESLQTNLRSVLQTTLQAEKAAVRNWVRMQQNIAASAMANEQVAATIHCLLADAHPDATTLELLNLSQAAELRRVLNPQVKAHKYDGFVILEKSGRIAASNRDQLVGVVLTDAEMEFIREKVMVAEPVRMTSMGHTARCERTLFAIASDTTMRAPIISQMSMSDGISVRDSPTTTGLLILSLPRNPTRTLPVVTMMRAWVEAGSPGNVRVDRTCTTSSAVSHASISWV